MEDRLQALMKMGYNIHIECRGKGRTYEMTYNVTANKIMVSGMSMEEKLDCYYTMEVCGKTLDEVIDKLEKEINIHVSSKLA